MPGMLTGVRGADGSLAAADTAQGQTKLIADNVQIMLREPRRRLVGSIAPALDVAKGDLETLLLYCHNQRMSLVQRIIPVAAPLWRIAGDLNLLSRRGRR
ncbi:hypothetical protein DSM3645_10512 [Blastopirellula marina DSM 3645]|uniref:Uncharacterized protein n=1 Tax=Blastopirellula marina DSM 3645 TaxID=314230 RepID=A3ZM43_9BACT|nr:hypothetical protein DSM3645_10512 [Blastopirellula marina DSM 3645]